MTLDSPSGLRARCGTAKFSFVSIRHESACKSPARTRSRTSCATFTDAAKGALTLKGAWLNNSVKATGSSSVM